MLSMASTMPSAVAEHMSVEAIFLGAYGVFESLGVFDE